MATAAHTQASTCLSVLRSVITSSGSLVSSVFQSASSCGLRGLPHVRPTTRAPIAKMARTNDTAVCTWQRGQHYGVAAPLFALPETTGGEPTLKRHDALHDDHDDVLLRWLAAHRAGGGRLGDGDAELSWDGRAGQQHRGALREWDRDGGAARRPLRQWTLQQRGDADRLRLHRPARG